MLYPKWVLLQILYLKSLVWGDTQKTQDADKGMLGSLGVFDEERRI
jgi:hypothetical protein